MPPQWLNRNGDTQKIWISLARGGSGSRPWRDSSLALNLVTLPSANVAANFCKFIQVSQSTIQQEMIWGWRKLPPPLTFRYIPILPQLWLAHAISTLHGLANHQPWNRDSNWVVGFSTDELMLQSSRTGIRPSQSVVPACFFRPKIYKRQKRVSLLNKRYTNNSRWDHTSYIDPIDYKSNMIIYIYIYIHTYIYSCT